MDWFWKKKQKILFVPFGMHCRGKVWVSIRQEETKYALDKWIGQTGNVLSVSLYTFYKIWSDKYDYVQRLFDLEFLFRWYVFKVTAHHGSNYGLSLF